MTTTRNSPAEVRFRLATEADWPAIWPVFSEIVADGDTYAYEPDLTSEQARALWLSPAPDETWLATDEAGTVLGTYHAGPNRPGPGSHVANASYMVAGSRRGRGVGRAMVLHSLQRLRSAGYRGLQFNAVVATNAGAVRLYEELGFRTLGAVPGGFRHPKLGFVDLLIMYRDL